MTPIVAIQGYSGCFHEEAARRFYSALTGQFPQIVECPTFESLYTAMSEGRATSAVMAIENTISGGLLLNFDLLRKHGKKIKGEVYLPIHQNLMAIPGQKLEDIREVRTHYMAIHPPFLQETVPVDQPGGIGRHGQKRD